MRSEANPGCLDAIREELREFSRRFTVDVDYTLACGTVLRKTARCEAGWELVWRTNAAWLPAASPSG